MGWRVGFAVTKHRHMEARLHLVDGTFELFRAHFSPRPSHAALDGRDLKASTGVVRSLISLLADAAEGVTHIAVAFDNPITSFRNQLFAGYKSDEGIEPALRAQFDEVERGVAAAGIVVWRMGEFEADDALATAARRFGSAVKQVRIMSPDKDLGQVVSGEKVVLVDRIRGRVTTETSLWEEKHLRPQSVPDFLALVGDPADGIPGLDGWGEKSTAQVLAHYRHLEEIPDGDWEVTVRGAARLADELRRHRAEAMLYRTLATLRTDVPLASDFEALRWRGFRADFGEWCAHARINVPRMPTRVAPARID